jgi:hypothetical protein
VLDDVAPGEAGQSLHGSCYTEARLAAASPARPPRVGSRSTLAVTALPARGWPVAQGLPRSESALPPASDPGRSQPGRIEADARAGSRRSGRSAANARRLRGVAGPFASSLTEASATEEDKRFWYSSSSVRYEPTTSRVSSAAGPAALPARSCWSPPRITSPAPSRSLESQRLPDRSGRRHRTMPRLGWRSSAADRFMDPSSGRADRPRPQSVLVPG